MASEVSAQSSDNSTSQNHSINTIQNNSPNNPNPFGNTYNLGHSTNGTNLLLSSPQFLASMPSLVAAAVAGITTFHQNNHSLLPVNQIQSGKDINSRAIPELTSTSKNNTSSGTSPTASSSSSSGTSSPVTTEPPHDLDSSQNQVWNKNLTFYESFHQSLVWFPLVYKGTLTNNLSILDLLKCKLSTSFHMVNDPRLLECGATACFQCILHQKDSENKLNCPCCNNIHCIPSNANKLIVNKNLQAFLSVNLQQINHLEDTMSLLDRIHIFH